MGVGKVPGNNTKPPLAHGQGEIRVGGAKTADNLLPDIDIEGKVYKPNVFYVLARGDIKYRGLEFKNIFTERVVKGARKLPF